MNITLKEFLSAFIKNGEEVNIRVFSDRKVEEPEYKGNKYSEKLENIETLLPVLHQHNEKNRGIFFVVNSGGHLDENITRINAQFVESDVLTLEDQIEQINLFALPPSIIVKTQKSLHTYWLMKDADVSRFREVQLRLVKQFNGDSACQNESRVLRIPGFYHCKKEPVMVECIKFEPDLLYTQEQLSKHLPEIEIIVSDTDSRTAVDGVVGSGERIIEKCAFIRHCRDNASNLPEPHWHAMVTNLSLAKDGAKLVHDISRPYPSYNAQETDSKIQRAISENKPHTCDFIKSRLCFKNCGDCKVKAPVVHCVLSLEEQAVELVNGEITEELIFSDNTVGLMAFAKKSAPILYGRFKIKIKGMVSMRDFESAVNSANSSDIVSYLSDYENTNLNKIPLMKSTERLGWLDETSFFPYTAPDGICFETELEDSSEVHKSLTEHGNYDKWLNAASSIRNIPYSRFMLASSFASPLLELLSHRVFFVNIWHDTKSSKTAVAKMAVAVWGNPLKIMGSFNATAVGLERKADTLRNILYGLDERQMANENRLSIAQIVYGLANGFGKIRGTKEGGVQSVTNWRLIVLSTAEEPLIRDDSHDGINTRVFEIHGQPLTDIELGTELHHISEKNYGFAGRIFIERLCSEIKKDKNKVTSDFDNILSEIKKKIPHATHLENAAVVALGDYYSDQWIWGAAENTAFKASVDTAVMMLKNNITHEKQDIIDRAWHYVIDWCAANERAFSDDALVVFGIKENNNTYFVFKSPLDEALSRKNYPVEKCMTGFFERGYMKHWNGKRQKQKKTAGKGLWYYVISIPEGEDDEKVIPLT